MEQEYGLEKYTVFKCQQINISVIYVHCLNTTSPPGQHYYGFTEIHALKRTRERFAVCIQVKIAINLSGPTKT